jgi:hypothetical protein
MHTCYKLGARAVCIIVLQEELPRLLVKCALRIGIDKEALDCHEDVGNAI